MSKLSEDKEFCELLAANFGVQNVNNILNEFDLLERTGMLQIVNDSSKSKALKNYNQLRFGYVFYISLKQLKDNLKDNMVLIVLSILLSDNKVTAAIIQMMARVLPCCHLIKPCHRCVFIRAVELYNYSEIYYKVDEFYKIMNFDGSCSNLTIECPYRKNQLCCISQENILDGLNSLVEMRILERNTLNEYRYNKW